MADRPRWTASVLALALAASIAPTAHAAWPERVVTLVSPFAPGGITDVLARLTAERLNQKLGHAVGFLNPILYANPSVCNDITSGSNIDYDAKPGWDPCTGLGSPDGAKLLLALQGL